MWLDLERGGQIFSLRVTYWEEDDTNACGLEIDEILLDGKPAAIELTSEEEADLFKRASTRAHEGDDD